MENFCILCNPYVGSKLEPGWVFEAFSVVIGSVEEIQSQVNMVTY